MIDYRKSVLVDRDVIFEVDGQFEWLHNEDQFMKFLQQNFATINQIKFVIVNSYANEDEVKFSVKNNGSLDLNEVHLDDDYDDFAELDLKEGKLYFDSHCEQAKFMRDHGFEHIEEKITNFLVKLNNQKEQADMDKSNSKQNGEHEIMNVNVDEITTALISQDFSLDNLEPAKQYVGQVDTNDLTRAVGRALIYQQNQDWLENGVEDELKDLVNDLSVSDAVFFAQQLDDYFEVYRTEDLQGDFSGLSTYDILFKFGDIDLNEPFYEFNGYGNAVSLSEDDVKERVSDFLLDQVDSQSLEDIFGALDSILVALDSSNLSDLKAQYEGIADANRDALEYEDYELLDNQIDDGDFLESTEVEEVVEKLKQAQKQVAEKSNSRGR